MFRPRIIPCLLLKGKGLVKTVNFSKPRYIGDPINAVHIFNKKEADELVFLDIEASKENRTIDLSMVKKIGDECFMPFSVGGGIKNIEQIKSLITAGAEKVIINSAAILNPDFIHQAVELFGSQSLIISIDVKKKLFKGREVVIYSGKKKTSKDPIKHALEMEQFGVGELLITSIEKEGLMEGYDYSLIKEICDEVKIPVVANGGAGTIEHMRKAVYESGANAVAAGSYFIYHGKRKAVLISYPSKEEKKRLGY